eukprot:6461737-Amphidinium_carterae.1
MDQKTKAVAARDSLREELAAQKRALAYQGDAKSSVLFCNAGTTGGVCQEKSGCRGFGNPGHFGEVRIGEKIGSRTEQPLQAGEEHEDEMEVKNNANILMRRPPGTPKVQTAKALSRCASVFRQRPRSRQLPSMESLLLEEVFGCPMKQSVYQVELLATVRALAECQQAELVSDCEGVVACFKALQVGHRQPKG